MDYVNARITTHALKVLGVFKATTLDTDTAWEKKNNSVQATGLLTCCWRRIPSFCFGSCALCEPPTLSSPSRQMISSSSSGQALPLFLPLWRCWAHSSPPLADQMNLNASSASLRPLGARQKWFCSSLQRLMGREGSRAGQPQWKCQSPGSCWSLQTNAFWACASDWQAYLCLSQAPPADWLSWNFFSWQGISFSLFLCLLELRLLLLDPQLCLLKR